MGRDSEKRQRSITNRAQRYSAEIEEVFKSNPSASNKELAEIFKSKFPEIYNSRTREWIGCWKKKGAISVSEDKPDRFEKRAIGESVRDEKGTITEYRYRIAITNRPDLVGTFTLEEMQTIYELYSKNDGANLNTRSVHKHFPKITFRDFKRIIRAFNITKDSTPVAPHNIESMSEGELKTFIRNNKENRVLHGLEVDRDKFYEAKYRELQREFLSSKKLPEELIERFKKHLKESDGPVIKVEQRPRKDSTFDLVVYVSDQHVGAANSKLALYNNKYNRKVFIKRMEALLQYIVDTSKMLGGLDNVIVIGLGDNLDGMDEKTTRGRKGHSNHKLTQNLDNRGQFDTYAEVMRDFFVEMYRLDVANGIQFHVVTNDNHSGDFGYFSNKLLQAYLAHKVPSIEMFIYEKFLDYFEFKNHTFIVSHGKDEDHMRFGMPLVLNEKIENQLNQYLDSKGLGSRDITVVSGDLHQTAITYGQRFRYKKVSSMFGSSEYIQLNYGGTPAGVDIELMVNGQLFTTHKVFRDNRLQGL